MPANTFNGAAVPLAQRLGALWRALRGGADGAANAASVARLEAALAEQQHRCAELARLNLRQLDTIGIQAGRLQAMAAAHAAAAGAVSRIEGRLAQAIHDKARERHANELLGAALTRAHQRMETIPRLEADLSALWARLEQRRSDDAAAAAAAGQAAQPDAPSLQEERGNRP